MQKLLKRLAILFLVLIITDFILGFFLNQVLVNAPDGRYYKANTSLNTCNEDVLVFGSSRAETNYAPNVLKNTLNLSCWNTGRGGQKLPFWYAISKGVLNRYTPKIAIINVEDDFLTEDLKDAYERAGILRPFYYSNPEIQPIIDNISQFEKHLLLSNTYAYNSSFYYLLRPYFLKGVDGELHEKGWKTRKGEIKKTKNELKVISSNQPLNEESVTLFEEFIKGFIEKGCKVYMFISPDFQKVYSSTSTIEYLKNRKDIKFFNFSLDTFISKNKHYFIDESHLNVEGAKYYTQKIGNLIFESETRKATKKIDVKDFILTQNNNVQRFK